ncbi:MAG TPA: hypothetical protein VI894_02860 [Candidatus Nanoarchaeia archaeon]|nr:hypothetical protein [Candidatus Nanoarchaeia archaeon]
MDEKKEENEAQPAVQEEKKSQDNEARAVKEASGIEQVQSKTAEKTAELSFSAVASYFIKAYFKFTAREIYATLVGLAGYVVWVLLFIYLKVLGLFAGIFGPFFSYMIAFSYFRKEYVKSMIASFAVFAVFLTVMIVLIKKGIVGIA